MDLAAFFKDKSVRPSAKTGILATALQSHQLSQEDLIAFAATAKDAVLGTCVESLEYVTKTDPAFVTSATLGFVITRIADNAPRVKLESARVTGNVIRLFPEMAEKAIAALLPNTAHEGTVVRWSAAFALSQILLLRLSLNDTLIPAAANIMDQEEKNSIKKIYAAALKKCATAPK
jgi:hypothetical protein